MLYENSDRSGKVQQISGLGAFLSSQAATKYNSPTSEFDGNVSYISVPEGLTVSITDLPNSGNNNRQKNKSVQGPQYIDIVASGLSVPLWSIMILNPSLPPPIPTNVTAKYDPVNSVVNVSWTPPDISMYNRLSIMAYIVLPQRTNPGSHFPPDNTGLVPGTGRSIVIDVSGKSQPLLIGGFVPNGYADAQYVAIRANISGLNNIWTYFPVSGPTAEELAIVASNNAAAADLAARNAAAILAEKQARPGYAQCLRDAERCRTHYNRVVNGTDIYQWCLTGTSFETETLCDPPRGCRWCMS
jgi:hypothetical protein